MAFSPEPPQLRNPLDRPLLNPCPYHLNKESQYIIKETKQAVCEICVKDYYDHDVIPISDAIDQG